MPSSSSLAACPSQSVPSARQQAVQETEISPFFFCLFSALCFLFCCSLLGFITSLSPSRVVAPFESTQPLLRLVFVWCFFCSAVSQFPLCWHGLILFSSSCCSTVVSFSWHLQPCLKHAVVHVSAAPLSVLDCSGSVLTRPERQRALPEIRKDSSDHGEAPF